MNEKLLDLSEKTNPFEVELFETIANVSKKLNVAFFVVGAAARDIILSRGYGIHTIRATEDIDLGVQVLDWSHFTKLRDGLIATGKFWPDMKQAQRLIYKDSFPIDVIPFGTIADPDNSLSWPPDHEIEMSTLGFEESYRTSIRIRFRAEPVLDVYFVSLSGLALLKLISWNDNYVRRSKDAKDILLLMRTYLDAGNQERLFNEEIDLVEREDFDYILASARLLGRDIAAILHPKTKETVIKILDRETGDQKRYRLVEDMMDSRKGSSDFETVLQLLEEMKTGVLERLQNYGDLK